MLEHFKIPEHEAIRVPIDDLRTTTEEIFLKCIGKYEINRGALIKPDWETSYLTINLDGLISTIDDKGIKKEGRTLIRRNSYTITHRDNRNRVKNIYKIAKVGGIFLIDRGDLSKEISIEKIPLAQREIFKIIKKTKNSTFLVHVLYSNNFNSIIQIFPIFY